MINGEKKEGWLASQLTFTGAMRMSTSKGKSTENFFPATDFFFPPVMRSWFLPLLSGHLILQATCMQHLQAVWLEDHQTDEARLETQVIQCTTQVQYR